MIALPEWLGWRRVSFLAVNRLVNRRGWRWVTYKDKPLLRDPRGQTYEFRLVRRVGALLKPTD